MDKETIRHLGHSVKMRRNASLTWDEAQAVLDVIADLERMRERKGRARCPSKNHDCENDPPQPEHCTECHAAWFEAKKQMTRGD